MKSEIFISSPHTLLRLTYYSRQGIKEDEWSLSEQAFNLVEEKFSSFDRPLCFGNQY